MTDFFPIPGRAEWLTLILSPYGEDPKDWTFPCWASVRGGRTKIFPKRASSGPTDLDKDDTLSTVTWMDLSGGSGIKLINPSTDLGNTWWHIADARGTDGWTTAPEKIKVRPSVYTGDHVPLGRIGASTYGLWGTDIHKWNSTSQTWGNALATVGTVVNTEGITYFNDKMYFPLGASGYSYVSESAPGTLGAVTTVAGAAAPSSNSPIPTSNPKVHAFAVYQEKLWVITTSADGHVLASSLTGGTGDWFWPYDTARAAFIKMSTSNEPHVLFEWLTPQQTPGLHCSTRRGLFIYDESVPGWVASTLRKPPPHYNFGTAVIEFRPGEAIWISTGGGDVWQYTSGGVAVPASGPGGAKQGMPVGKRGDVISMASDLANLYMLTKGRVEDTEETSFLEDTSGADPLYVPSASGVSTLISWTGKGFHPLWESDPSDGIPTRVVVSDAVDATGAADYRVFWNTGADSWSMAGMLDTYSSRQAIHAGANGAGLRRFASTGYIEFGEFYAGTFALRKLASHVNLYLPYANATNYVEFEYGTEANDDDEWITLGDPVTTQHELVTIPFGLSADGKFSSGLSNQFIRGRLRFQGAGGYVAPVVSGLSIAYMPLPGDAATKTYTVPLPIDVDPKTDLTREQIIAKLESLVTIEEFVYLKHQERTYRAYVASIGDTGMASRDASGTLQLTVIQIPSGVPGLEGEL